MTNGVSTSFFAMVLEDQHVAHSLIALQIDYARYVRSDYVSRFHGFRVRGSYGRGEVSQQ